MRKALFILWLIWLLSITSMAKRVIISIRGNYLSGTDSSYKNLYEGKKYFPEGKIAFSFTGNLYVWANYGLLPASAEWSDWSNKEVIDPDLNVKTKSTKHFMSGGIGFRLGYLNPGEISIKLEAGMCKIRHREITKEYKIGSDKGTERGNRTTSGIGFHVELGVTYGLIKNIFAEISAGYLYATDKINEESVKLGGFKLGLGIGITF